LAFFKAISVAGKVSPSSRNFDGKAAATTARADELKRKTLSAFRFPHPPHHDTKRPIAPKGC
jgi:hypothetical protein